MHNDCHQSLSLRTALIPVNRFNSPPAFCESRAGIDPPQALPTTHPTSSAGDETSSYREQGNPPSAVLRHQTISMYSQNNPTAMAPPQKPETFMLSDAAQQSLPQDAQVALQQVDNCEQLPFVSSEDINMTAGAPAQWSWLLASCDMG